ncbi:hypothetical protein U4E84_11190 [Halorubrum sp. AD140]|uniref:DUF7093 family protein n=1 Tax=Halorubrum sp. AD140 TaxID=3050073 RepID=UPI002ACC7433|nr:hypothetical protein [Halorubrum sp. AD140]MDZ5811906.1 hypothetical protein [Halorubrum sp. AD140]
MGLRCLLGHDFGEPELRREREEDGNEVVTTVTEVKTCDRCGETQVVSENTEVTTMEQLADEAAAGARAPPDPAGGEGSTEAGDDPAGASAVGPDPDAARADAGVDDAERDQVGIDDDDVVDDAVIIDDGPTAATGEETASLGDETADDRGTGAGDDDGAVSDNGDAEYTEYPEMETADPSAAERDAETDDGVILDEEGESDGDRERGAWPAVDEADEESATETAPWPDPRGEDEGFSAEVGDGDAGAVEFGGGLTPETAEPVAEGEDAEYVEAPERDADEVGGTIDSRDDEAGTAGSGTGITRPESPDLSTSTSETAVEYHCPECEMTRDADGSSMRAGDICPECKRGYVTERPI